MLTARPFQPFELYLADGRSIKIRHPEFIAVNPGGRTTVVLYPDDTFEAVDTLLITSVKTIDGEHAKGERTE